MTKPVVFDPEEMAAAFERPRFRFRKRIYVGRHLSAPQWFAFEERLRTAQMAEAKRPMRPDSPVFALLTELADLLFPRPWWAIWRPRVSQIIRLFPFAVQLEFLGNFWTSQVLAHGFVLTPALREEEPTTTSTTAPVEESTSP